MKQFIHRQPVYMIFMLMMFFSYALTPVHADTGPKPTLTIQCEGFPDNSYVTVLSAVSHYGPNIPWTQYGHDDDFYNSRGIRKEVYEAFAAEAQHISESGEPYYFWGIVSECEQEYYLGYWPPEEFKILIYLEDTDSFLLSEETYTRKAFRSTYQCTYSGNALVIHDVSSAFPSPAGFLMRLILTIAVEYLISLVFMKHTFQSRTVLILANIATQLFLNFILASVTVKYGTGAPVYLIAVLMSEAIIILAEWLVYRKWIAESQLKHPLFYSVSANLSSYILGLLIAGAVPLFPM